MYLIALTLLILFFAALTKATLGFGESILAIPLLTLVLGLQVAAPLMALLAGAITLMLLVKGWERVDFKASWRLLLGAAVGVPVGVWGLKTLPTVWTTTALGVFLIVVGLYNLTQPSLVGLSGKHWPYFFGLVAGTLGGAYNIASPPILVYGIARRWSPQEFRFTLQSFFLPLSTIILISHASAGLWTIWVFQLFALSLPVMVLAFWLGNRFSRMMTIQHFERMVYVGLIVLGIALLV
jgi:uncharacterized membrane protein YfcA